MHIGRIRYERFEPPPPQRRVPWLAMALLALLLTALAAAMSVPAPPDYGATATSAPASR